MYFGYLLRMLLPLTSSMVWEKRLLGMDGLILWTMTFSENITIIAKAPNIVFVTQMSSKLKFECQKYFFLSVLKNQKKDKWKFYRMPELQRNQQPGRTGEADLLLQPGCCVVEPTVQAKDHSRPSYVNPCCLMWSTILPSSVSILILRERKRGRLENCHFKKWKLWWNPIY